MTKIQFELCPKPSKAEKAAQGKSGFVPVAVRWVIERSNAWVERCKNLVKNFEWTLEHARAKLNLCFIRLMVKRLAIVGKDVKWVLYARCARSDKATLWCGHERQQLHFLQANRANLSNLR